MSTSNIDSAALRRIRRELKAAEDAYERAARHAERKQDEAQAAAEKRFDAGQKVGELRLQLATELERLDPPENLSVEEHNRRHDEAIAKAEERS